jgi:alpha-tubulin suppressor-like RCC1 family protein
VPVQVKGLTTAKSLVTNAEDQDFCALLQNGGAECWGGQVYGSLGNPSVVARPANVPVPVTGLSGAVRLLGSNGGDYGFCALLKDGNVECWGVYTGTTTPSSTPVKVSGLVGVVSVSVSGATYCAALANGMVKCWGWNRGGSLGTGSSKQFYTAVPVATTGLNNAAQLFGPVGTTVSRTCAILRSSAVKCWGDNHQGGAGVGSTAFTIDVPTAVKGLTGATSLAGEGFTTCAVLRSGGVKCWGGNVDDELGTASVPGTGSDVPVSVPGFVTS